MLKLGVITPMMMLSSILMIFLTSPSLAWIVVFFSTFVVVYVAVKRAPYLKNNKNTGQDNKYVRENSDGLRAFVPLLVTLPRKTF